MPILPDIDIFRQVVIDRHTYPGNEAAWTFPELFSMEASWGKFDPNVEAYTLADYANLEAFRVPPKGKVAICINAPDVVYASTGVTSSGCSVASAIRKLVANDLCAFVRAVIVRYFDEVINGSRTIIFVAENGAFDLGQFARK